MLRVLWSAIFMAVCSETPARTRLRTPERRRSWNSNPGQPAALHAASQRLRKDPIGWPARAANGLTNDDIHALAIDLVTSSTLYAGTSLSSLGGGVFTGGVFKSTDGGTSWSPVLADSVTALVIDPGAPAIVYAGTACDGVLKSPAGGPPGALQV